MDKVVSKEQTDLKASELAEDAAITVQLRMHHQPYLVVRCLYCLLCCSGSERLGPLHVERVTCADCITCAGQPTLW
jgi:hypothetical protein